MRVLIVHNRYRERGGEDMVVDAEARLMRDAGWDVRTYERHNDELDDQSRVAAGMQSIWSRRTGRELLSLLDRHPRDIVHVHNTVPLVSSSVFGAARRSGAAVVQTLHNFRPVCISGLLMRDDVPCHACVTRRVATPGIASGCWRGSRAQSAVLASSIAVHRARGTYRDDIDAFIAPTAFGRSVFEQSGFTQAPIHVKPHFLHDPPDPATGSGTSLLFVGRLAREKGIDVLVDAWRSLPMPIPLVIIGDGPMREDVQRLAAHSGGMVTWRGRTPRHVVLEHMARSRAVLVPSRAYETFCLTAVEAAACARATIVSGHGALAEVVQDGRTGWHVPVGDSSQLAAAMLAAWTQADESERRGRCARNSFDERWCAAANLRQLETIYADAIARRRAGSAT